MPDRTLVIHGSVDTHCHVAHLPSKGLDPQSILRSVRNQGMRACIDVGVWPADLPERTSLAGGQSWIAFTSGIHPSEITRGNLSEALELLASQLDAGGVVAVGEIGLDYHWDTGERKGAVELFDAQVQLAVRADLPVVVHNREADSDVLEVLARHRPRGVMHCFSQDAEFCRKCLNIGLYISFAGNLTYKRSEDIRAAAAMVPVRRLLVETDSPYLSPEPVRGYPNHPGHLGFTLERLADIRKVDIEDLNAATAGNAFTLFGL